MTIARKILEDLPPVFHRNTFMRLTNGDEGWAKLALFRWCQSGDLKMAGPRSSIYYNMIVNPRWQDNIVSAIHLAYPSPVLVGASVLHTKGWITQIPRKIEIVKPDTASKVSLEGVETYERPVSWYKEYGPFTQANNLLAMAALTPVQAIKDCLVNKGKQGFWCPDQDDLYVPDEFENDVKEIFGEHSVEVFENHSGNRNSNRKGMKRGF